MVHASILQLSPARVWVPLPPTLVGVLGRGFQIRKRRRRKKNGKEKHIVY